MRRVILTVAMITLAYSAEAKSPFLQAAAVCNAAYVDKVRALGNGQAHVFGNIPVPGAPMDDIDMMMVLGEIMGSSGRWWLVSATCHIYTSVEHPFSDFNPEAVNTIGFHSPEGLSQDDQELFDTDIVLSDTEKLEELIRGWQRDGIL